MPATASRAVSKTLNKQCWATVAHSHRFSQHRELHRFRRPSPSPSVQPPDLSLNCFAQCAPAFMAFLGVPRAFTLQ